MARVSFTQNLSRHLACAPREAEAGTVRELLEAVFADSPALRGYVLDDQGALRKHVAVFVNGSQIKDRRELSDGVGREDEVFVMQALSGG
ncbi:MAG: MoaD/ThiS family protein [Acidobacteriota bacterium]|nr:MAG: MoaD/ThiS family protein [Acidobacteriota bacterium]